MALNSDSNFVYILNDRSAPAITNLITDLNKRSKDLEVKYVDTIKRIQDSTYDYQYDDQKLENIYREKKQNRSQMEYNQLLEKNKQQNDMINNLASSLNDIAELQKKLLNTTTSTINNVRSFKGQNLAVTPVDNNNNYLININNNCLNVDSNNIYSLKPCNTQSSQQLFKINTITDEISFYNHYGSHPTQQDLQDFPFSVIKSNVNNYCLTDNNVTGISVDNCTNLEGQKWRGMKRDNVSCNQ
jgi:hypothetical protein